MRPRQRGHGPHQDVEPLAGDQPADPADHEGPLGQPGAGPGGAADALVEAEADGLDPVRYDVHPRGRHPPPLQPGGHGVGDGHGGRAQAFAGQVQRAHPARERPALDLALAEGVFGGHGRPGAREPGREAPVDTGPVQVRVHEVVLAAPDEPHQPGQRPQVPVAPHAQVDDPDPVGAQPLGHRPGVGQRQYVALHRHVAQQQPQLLFGAADAEPGDDVQCLDRLERLHRCTPRRSSRTWWRSCLIRSRAPPSAWLTCVRGSACGPASRPGSMAQA